MERELVLVPALTRLRNENGMRMFDD